MAETWIISPNWVQDVLETQYGALPSVPYTPSEEIKDNLLQHIDRSVQGGKLFTTDILSTYSLVYTAVTGYIGGVLAPNGDIHFIPFSANIGQKINASGVVSTYSLVYTATNAYLGGILAPNGDIHFVPSAIVGQKLTTNSAIPFGIGMCASQFLNKL
jgi:hypothetical protein